MMNDLIKNTTIDNLQYTLISLKKVLGLTYTSIALATGYKVDTICKVAKGVPVLSISNKYLLVHRLKEVYLVEVL